MKKKIKFLYIDIMREIWGLHHKFILHHGKYDLSIWITCHHHNPWNVLTPRLFDKQMSQIRKSIELLK